VIISEDPPRIDARSAAGAGMPARAWPEIPVEMLALVEHLCAVLHRERGDELSTTWEERLPDLVSALVERSVISGGVLGVSPVLAARLAADDSWRAEVEWAVLVRASLLWPLSLLVYEDVEDIQCLGADRILVEAAGRKQLLQGAGPAAFSALTRREADVRLEEWFRTVLSYAGVQPRTQLTRDQPRAVATMATAVGQVRIAVVVAPAAVGRNSVYACLRIPRTSGPSTLEEFVANGTIPSGVAVFLRECVRAKLNIVISGGTGAGKTTLMRALCAEVGDDETLLVIEDSPELALAQERPDGRMVHENTITMATVPGAWKEQEARVTMEDLGRDALRFLPSRIIIGEARGAEMADAANAMTTGHEGSMVSVHANSAAETISKVVNYVMMAPRFAGQVELATRVAHHAIHLVVHLRKSQRLGRRAVTGVVAYSAEGAAVDVYRGDEHDALIRHVHSIADLPRRLQEPLAEHLAEVPAP
jgi:Flp pilus assembly CpaF family ATPase